MTVVPEALELIQPVIWVARVPVCRVCVCEDTANCFFVGLPGGTIDRGRIGAIRDVGERRLEGPRRHLQRSGRTMKGA
jgi:hypothetical protein